MDELQELLLGEISLGFGPLDELLGQLPILLSNIFKIFSGFLFDFVLLDGVLQLVFLLEVVLELLLVDVDPILEATDGLLNILFPILDF